MAAARIYRPAPNAMQSGKGKSKQWVLVFEQATPREIDPLMGYTSTTRHADAGEAGVRDAGSGGGLRAARGHRLLGAAGARPDSAALVLPRQFPVRPQDALDALIRRIVRPLLPLIFGCLSSGAALADPALWRVSDSDSSIWLFGSVHILDPNVTWRTPAFNEVLSGADEVYFELVLNADGMASLGRLTIERGFLPAGQTLSDILSPDQSKRLDKALAELGLAADDVRADAAVDGRR